MEQNLNNLGQPVGPPMGEWRPPPFPPWQPMQGRTCRLEPLNPQAHADALFESCSRDREGAMWTYLPSGPFTGRDAFLGWIEAALRRDDPQFYAIIPASSGRAAGAASHMRIDPGNGCIEVGHITLSPELQRTTASTEAMYLMMRRAFELGYRRYEWKCHALNAPSRAAAERLGFTFEGVFRQAVVVKGRSRDTAWYSIVDAEWPALRDRIERWLEPSNFDSAGKQIMRLGDI